MRQAATILLLIIIPAVLFSNCTQNRAYEGVSLVPPGSNDPYNTPRTCYPGPGATGSPQTIEDVVSLINTLPRPVTVPCLLEALDRPLDIYGTNSTGSAQPSPDATNPRIFIIRNNLYISVVPKGIAKSLVEFSQLQSTSTSTKAELEFPITTAITVSAPFDRIRFNAGTTCGLCHSGEVPGPTPYSFTSKAIKPSIFAKIPFDTVKSFYLTCDKNADPERCEILRSIFGHGTTRAKEFPASMPGI